MFWILSLAICLAVALVGCKFSSNIDMYSSFNFGPPKDIPTTTVREAISLAQKHMEEVL